VSLNCRGITKAVTQWARKIRERKANGNIPWRPTKFPDTTNGGTVKRKNAHERIRGSAAVNNLPSSQKMRRQTSRYNTFFGDGSSRERKINESGYYEVPARRGHRDIRKRDERWGG